MSESLCQPQGQGGAAGTGQQGTVPVPGGEGSSAGTGQQGPVPAPVGQGRGGLGRAGQRPFVVALGGGHGLAVTLSAVSRYAGQVTAVVSVADDGGSSGRLKQWWHGPAPGDIRRCLLALAGDGPHERVWAQALDYRFTGGELDGHSLGNLVLVALSETSGDFGLAISHVARLLGARATVLPATVGPVVLWAEMSTPEGVVHLAGQAKVAHAPGRLRRIWLDPPSPAVPDQVLEAIGAADQVVIGPGSLFTSVLAACAVPGIRDALRARHGGRIYVCNLDHQVGETLGFDADAHADALVGHGIEVDTIVCDPLTPVGALSDGPGGAWAGRWKVVTPELASPNGHSHDPCRLAQVLEGLAHQAP